MSKDDISKFNDMVNDITQAAGLGVDEVDSIDEIDEYGNVTKEASTEEADTESIKLEEKEVTPEPEVKTKEVEEENKEEEVTEEKLIDDELETGEEKGQEDQPKVEGSEKYVPNLKYSVRGEEKEIPEYLVGSITDVESESKIRDLLTKVDGIDGIKESRDTALARAEKAERTNVEHDEYYDSLNNMIKKKDWDNFYKHASIKEDDILDYAEEILRRRSLAPHEQAAIQRDADVRLENIHMEKQNRQVSSERDEMQARLDRMEIDNAFRDPEIAEAERLFDERMGKSGSFKMAMAEIGAAAWDTPNRLSVVDACRETIRRYGIKAETPATEAPAKEAPKEHKPVEGVEKRVVVRDVEHIPSVKHNASKTPVKRVVKDVDDMFNEADEYLSRNQ